MTKLSLGWLADEHQLHVRGARSCTMSRRLLVTIFVSATLGVGLSATEAKIAVFVAPQTREGFVDVDQGILDSIKDIQNELRSSRVFTLAPTPERATIALIVV